MSRRHLTPITFPDGTTQSSASTGGTGGSVVLKTAVIACPTVAMRQYAATVTDSSVTATSKILATQSGTAATGRSADEAEMEPFMVTAIPAAGSFRAILTAFPCSRLQGNVRIDYLVG